MRSANFFDANTRHWEDAELLFEQDHLANADYLYGLSAECGLKTIMIQLGLKTDESGSPEDSKYRKHVHELWEPFISWTRNRGRGAGYLHLLPSDDPFRDWSHHDRYVQRDDFRRSDVELHGKAARKVRDMVKRARMQGEGQS